jgi:hypothetical protein
MPGPNSNPNPDHKRDTPQYVPATLASRIREFEQQQPKNATGYRKPGSQKK